ncbi:hypothetical protein [Microbacterium paraoxydans]|uniref:hypothetical protein n=1 Tax=Microbacterium paraoxydans TaxID=199592 RepID=UPI0011A3C27A|nr:hypothetical protein [Microbacterium paraoxydans]
MVLEIGGELAVYLVVGALGSSIGISSGMTLPRGLGVVVAIVNVVIVGGVVAVGFLLGSEAPWIGPLFVFAALVMRVVAGAMELARLPALSEESFVHRAVLVFSPRRVRILENANARDPGEALTPEGA